MKLSARNESRLRGLETALRRSKRVNSTESRKTSIRVAKR
jgi:hypothetical protein